MTRRHWLIGFLSLVTVLALSSLAYAAQGYTQTAESYPPPPECPPMCADMVCIICTSTGNGTAPQQMQMEVSLLVPATTPATDYGIEVRDGIGQVILLPGGDPFRFDRCETCPGPVESPAPAGFQWVNFKSQSMDMADGSMQFVPHPTGPPGTPLPAMFWVSDTADDLYGTEVTNLLSLFPMGTVSEENLNWGQVKVLFLGE
jgi:hypothetical protein